MRCGTPGEWRHSPGVFVCAGTVSSAPTPTASRADPIRTIRSPGNGGIGSTRVTRGGLHGGGGAPGVRRPGGAARRSHPLDGHLRRRPGSGARGQASPGDPASVSGLCTDIPASRCHGNGELSVHSPGPACRSPGGVRYGFGRRRVDGIRCGGGAWMSEPAMNLENAS
jgi:hypothetical protein